MRRICVVVVVGLIHACGPTSDAEQRTPPSLVILMVVDQFRPDLLNGYDALYTGGFRRLLDTGYRFTDATHDHAVTTTGPGHTTLATGVYPTRHGIVGNTWSELRENEWQSIYSMEDLNSRILGYPELPGRSSANIVRSGLPDWIAQQDPRSRVVSISRKDRAAIGLAAQATGDVYWLAERGGEFITSDYYHAEYPDWMANFNATALPLIYADTIWESTIPAEALSWSRPDTSRYEFDREHTAFPHLASESADITNAGEVNRWRYRYTPFPDRAVVSLASEAVRELQLGQRGSVDYLGISLSQTDLIGHNFGPRSREQLDNLLRLDSELGRFFEFLDDAVGRGRWVLALSADHGVLDIPEHLVERGIDAGAVTVEDSREIRLAIQAALDGLDAGGAPEGEAPEDAVKAALEALPILAAAYTFSEVEAGAPADSFQVLFANSHSRTRVVGAAARWEVYVRYPPNVRITRTYPASHSSPYYYDRHVPMIFMGGSIQPGVSSDRVATVDVAPTLAWLAGISAPDDLDGRVLERVLER